MSLRVTPAEFQRIKLRCHALLADVPLHDVWAIPLEGGGPGRTIRDAHAILFGSQRPRATPAVRGLFKLRWALGGVFGWDDEQHDALASSYLHRFTPFYMALIEPFRRFVVYPALCRGAQRSWTRTYAAARA